MTEACVQVKAVMRAVKHWRNGVHWLKSTHRPNSYLLDLLVIKAAQHTHSSVHLCVCVSMTTSASNVRKILVRGVNAPLPPEAKKIMKI